MKTCPSCHRLYNAESGFCPVDGQKLDLADPDRPPTHPDDPRVGQRLCDRYVIFRVIADGGMGRVYQALDVAAQRTVAMKILHTEVASDPVQLERFRREFEVSAKLPHDYIVEVLAFESTADGTYALVMEYLEGEELRMVLKREKVLPPERVIRIVSQVALGLERAHALQQVHRDLKPDNLFLCHTPEGDVVKILDFGSVRDNSSNAKKLTVMGTTIGSPFYMSPEQAQGLPGLDHRADVWSMGAIVYETLGGRVPFYAPSGPAILLAILSEDPVPLSVVGKSHGAVPMLDDVLELALAKTPDHRYATMGALADAIGQGYGLEGDYRAWAKLPEGTLREQLATSMPKALAAHEAKQSGAVDTSAMDAAFREAAQPTSELAPAGIPSRPAWLIPVVVGIAIAAIAVASYFLTRS